MMEFTRDDVGDIVPRLSDRFPFTVSEGGPGEGRCLRTTRDIRPEETVLTDTAVFLGPSSPTACIVCCEAGGGEERCGGLDTGS